MQKETGELILSEIIKINGEIGKIHGEIDKIHGEIGKIDRDMFDLREEMKLNFSDMADHITFISNEIIKRTERQSVYA